MRIYRHHLLLAAIIALSAASCKTTEENYRKAYEAATEQQREATGLDSTIYGRIRNQAVTSRLAVGGDSLPVRREYIGYTDGEGASRENIRRYNVVVGQFKQVFNARQMRRRLIDAGYDNAMIVHTREPLYYVISASVSTPEEALAAWQRVTSDRSLVLKSLLPFILTPANFK